MIGPRKLPKPDAFGNLWFGSKLADTRDPAVFPGKRRVRDQRRDTFDVVADGTFIVFLGSRDGFLFEGADFRRFSSAELALAEVNRRRV